MVPEGWKLVELSKVVQQGRKISYGIVQPGEHDPDGVFLIRGQDYSRGWAQPEKYFRVSPEIDRPYRRSKVRPGDIVMTIVGANTGATAVVPEFLDGANITQTTARIAVDPVIADPTYVINFLSGYDGQREVYRFVKGGAQPGLNIGDVERFLVVLPPLPEQQKIAEILSTWDKAIETTEALLANARTQKRALMQSLLTGTRRFPGFEDHPWREVRLGDVLEITYGKSPKEIFVDGGDYPVIGTGGETGRTNTVMAQGPAIIIGRKGTIDSPQWVEGGFWCIDTTYYCYAKGGNNLGWLFAWLWSINLKDFNEASGVPSLSRETLRAITLKLPSVPEQHLIAKVMIDIDTDITTIMAQLDHLRTEKKSLMQQLLTGKRRVVV